MILSQFEEAVWHRWGSDCDIAEAWHHGGEIVSAVEAVLEFGEVAGCMLVADGAVRASDGALDVAEGGVDPLEGRVPGGGLGDAKPAAQLNAGDAALALSEVVHGAKPSAQRHLGCRENRSGDHGCLPPTGGTLVKRPGLDEAVMLPCANRADKAGWPAPAHHRLPALILCSVKNSKLGLAEPLLKLHLVARHRSNPQKQPYVPVLYHALMAEDSA